MRRAKLIADFARHFSNDFQIPANSVQEDGFGHVTPPAKLAAFSRLKAAIANVLKVCR
jgi:hypothetical protein